MRLPFDRFDLIARYYDFLMSGVGSRMLPDVLRLAPGQWVLDVGGGTGRVSAWLKPSGARLVVCDQSRPMMGRAQTKGLRAVQASADRLPFASHSIERMLVVDAFHHFTGHVPDMQRRVAQELLRVLKPGGRVVVEEFDLRHPTARLIALGEKVLLMGSHFLAPHDLAALFEAAGARTVEMREDGMSVLAVFMTGQV